MTKMPGELKSVQTQTGTSRLSVNVEDCIEFFELPTKKNSTTLFKTEEGCLKKNQMKLFDMEKLFRDKGALAVADFICEGEGADIIVVLETIIEILCDALEKKRILLERNTCESSNKLSPDRELLTLGRFNKKSQRELNNTTETAANQAAETNHANLSMFPKGEEKQQMLPRNKLKKSEERIKTENQIENNLNELRKRIRKLIQRTKYDDYFQINGRADATVKIPQKIVRETCQSKPKINQINAAKLISECKDFRLKEKQTIQASNTHKKCFTLSEIRKTHKLKERRKNQEKQFMNIDVMLDKPDHCSSRDDLNPVLNQESESEDVVEEQYEISEGSQYNEKTLEELEEEFCRISDKTSTIKRIRYALSACYGKKQQYRQRYTCLNLVS